jgi:Zn-dependent protease
MDLAAIAQGVAVWALPVIIAITFHEAAHGFVAWRLGDDTAKRLGRVTFNPIRHIDLMGTIIVPAVLLLATSTAFGWAKPVPVDFSRLRNPRRDMIWVAAAGPGINLVLAVASAFLVRPTAHLPVVGAWFEANFVNAIVINLVLAVFNMIPLPPLDGGRVAVGLLPRRLAMQLAQLERFGLLTIIALLFILPMIGRQLGVSLEVLPWLIGGPVEFLFRIIAWMAG